MSDPARAPKKAGYHHGNLRAALIDTAIELLGERGVQGFSLAEASRRLGVAVAAPYRHFADREELLVAVAIRAAETFSERMARASDPSDPPARRLSQMVRTYIGFAYDHRPLFQAMFALGLDKSSQPELNEAGGPIKDGFFDAALGACDGDQATAIALAGAIGATAHGYAMLLLDGGFDTREPDGSGGSPVQIAADLAAGATLALIAGRDALRTTG